MKNTKIAAILLSAVLSVSAFSVPTFAVATTTSVSKTATNTWNGKATLEAGKTYYVEKNISISSKVTIPAKTTLVVRKGVTLTVKSNGTLYIKGTLNIEKTAKVSVSGTLNLYKSKILKNYGTLSLGKTSIITLSGKLTNYSTGTITGTPKKLTKGKTAVITNKGKIKTKGIIEAPAELPSETEIAALIKTAMESFIINNDYKKIMDITIPKEYYDVLEAEMAVMDMTMDDYFAMIASMVGDLELTVGDEDGTELVVTASNVKAIDVSVSELKAMTADELKKVNAVYDEINAAYGLNLKVTETFTAKTILTITTKDGKTYTAPAEDIGFMAIGGKYYITDSFF